MLDSETTIIALSNETTASQSFYKVSDAIADLLAGLSEDELSRHMPKPSLGMVGEEEDAYADALIGLARAHGIPDKDIMAEVADVPTFFFDTGWRVCEDDGDRLGEPILGTQPGISQDEIEELVATSDLVDYQYETREDGASRLVRIVSDGDRYLAIAPTYETAAALPHGDDRVWDQPYEVEKVTTSTVLSFGRWVPVDDGGGDGVESAIAATDESLGDGQDGGARQVTETLWEIGL